MILATIKKGYIQIKNKFSLLDRNAAKFPRQPQHQSKKEYQYDLSNNQERVYTNQNKFIQL